jgi:hypothetical protein
MKSRDGNNPERRLYTYGFWMALCIALLVVAGLVYLTQRVDPSYQEQLKSISSSLIASICFAVIFTLFSNRELISLIRREIEKGNASIAATVVRDVNQHFIAYNPSNVYLPTTGVDHSFNSDISNDLRGSSFYFFHGVSGKYVAARVMYSRHPLSLLRVMIIDPRDVRSLALRARDRSTNPKYRGKTIDDLIAEVKSELYMSIISLFDCRYLSSVEIAYGVGTSVLRLEIFDEAMYMSLYHTVKSSQLHFPETLRYSKSSVLYDMFRLHTAREFDICDKRIRFDSVSDEETLLDHLREMGMEDPSLGSVGALREEYKTFCDVFVEKSGIKG